MTDTTTLTTTDLLKGAYENLQSSLDEDSPDKYVLLHAATEIHRAVEDYEEAQQSINDQPEGWKFDWSQLNSAVDSEIRVQLWGEIVARSSESKELADLTVTVEVVRATAADRAKRLLNDWDRGSSSDSMSNSIDAIKRQVNSRFVQYFSGDEMTIAEVK